MFASEMEGCLTKRVLVLNRLWQAVNVIGSKRAFSLLSQEHARVIHSIDDDFHVLQFTEWVDYSITQHSSDGWDCVRTVRWEIRVPKILLLSHYDRLPMKEVKFTRQSLFERDNFTCQYCRKTFPQKNLNLDHVIPRERGGKTTWENIVTSCLRCNGRKGNRLPHEASMRLVRKPQRPKYRPFINFVLGSDLDESWLNFLNLPKNKLRQVG